MARMSDSRSLHLPSRVGAVLEFRSLDNNTPVFAVYAVR